MAMLAAAATSTGRLMRAWKIGCSRSGNKDFLAHDQLVRGDIT
jgi:hypothetical protein